MPQIYDMGPTALLPLRRKACWGFFRPKIPTASAGLEPANLVTKGQKATARPPKPPGGFVHGKVYFTIGLNIKYFFFNFLDDQKFDIILDTVIAPHIPPRLQNNRLHLTSLNTIFFTVFYISLHLFSSDTVKGDSQLTDVLKLGLSPSKNTTHFCKE